MKQILIILLTLLCFSLGSCTPDTGITDYPVMRIGAASFVLLMIGWLILSWIKDWEIGAGAAIIFVAAGSLTLITMWGMGCKSNTQAYRFIEKKKSVQQTLQDFRTNKEGDPLERAAVISEASDINKYIAERRADRHLWWEREFVSPKFDTLSPIK